MAEHCVKDYSDDYERIRNDNLIIQAGDAFQNVLKKTATKVLLNLYL